MLSTSIGLLSTSLSTSSDVLSTWTLRRPARPDPRQVDDLGQRLALLSVE
jgi:hypothetical protein